MSCLATFVARERFSVGRFSFLCENSICLYIRLWQRLNCLQFVEKIGTVPHTFHQSSSTKSLKNRACQNTTQKSPSNNARCVKLGVLCPLKNKYYTAVLVSFLAGTWVSWSCCAFLLTDDCNIWNGLPKYRRAKLAYLHLQSNITTTTKASPAIGMVTIIIVLV